MDKIKFIIKAAFCKRDQKGSWIYLFAAMLFVLFGVVGGEYGAFWVYFPAAMLCFAQFFYPTLIVWGTFVTAFLLITGELLFSSIKDIIIISTGGSPSILTDFDDSLFFLLYLALLIAICYGMIKYRPKKRIC